MLPMVTKKQKLVQKDLEVDFSTPLCNCFPLLSGIWLCSVQRKRAGAVELKQR